MFSGEIDVAVVFRAGEHLEDTARDVATHMKAKGTKAFWMQVQTSLWWIPNLEQLSNGDFWGVCPPSRPVCFRVVEVKTLSVFFVLVLCPFPGGCQIGQSC